MVEPYRLLVADPPWPFKDKLPGSGRGAARNYRLLTIPDICSFPLPPIADDAALFLWRVGAMQREALDVAEAWGFVVKAELVWEKLRRCGACAGSGRSSARGEAKRGLLCARCAGLGALPWFGMGRIVRGAHETCLLATRGRPTRLSASVRSSFSALMPTDARGRVVHSAKPDAFFRVAEALYGGPRVELFARRRRAGWTCYGDELPPEEGGEHAVG